MKIKVCGLKYPDNINEVAKLEPDFAGFICYGKSPRFVDDIAAIKLNKLPVSISKTAVFVNESKENIEQLITRFGFDAIQLHGSETPDFANSFKNRVTVFKAFGLDNDFDFSQLDAYMGKVDYFLFDTKTDVHGGSGKIFNWDVLNGYKLNVPFFLSGGLSLDNLEQVKNITHTRFYGVDLNSRFETAPAIKDINKLKQAFAMLK